MHNVQCHTEYMIDLLQQTDSIRSGNSVKLFSLRLYMPWLIQNISSVLVKFKLLRMHGIVYICLCPSVQETSSLF